MTISAKMRTLLLVAGACIATAATVSATTWAEDAAPSPEGATAASAPAAGPDSFAVFRRAAQPGVIYGSKAVGEPPLMLAFSVREAIRQAVTAFRMPSGSNSRVPGTSASDGTGAGLVVELAAPSTPEAVYWAVDRMRREAVAEVS